MQSLRKIWHGATAVGLLLTAVFGAMLTPAAKASAGNGTGNLKIVAWYGAGNLSKSQYTRDTVILFNPTTAAISINGWSLQTGGSTGSFTTIYKLPNVSIPAGHFFAIAGSGTAYISSNGCSSSICNANFAYDYQLKTVEGTQTTTDNDLSSTAITVALVSSVSSVGTCPKTASTLVDLVGIGAVDGSSPVTCYAGSGYAPYTPATLNGAATNINGVVYPYATVRKNICNDTFDNYNDFSLAYIDFKNANSPAHVCPTGTQLTVASSATPNNPGVTETVLIKAVVTPATSPNSTGLFVTADLSNIGLSTTQQLYDDGTHGDTKAGDGTYSLSTPVPSGQIGLVVGAIVTATDALGEVAHDDLLMTIAAGSFALSSTASTSASVNAGEVVKFPVNITAAHGYSGTLNVVCTGSPNTNSLGVPISTQCVATPNEVPITTNGTTSFSLAIATGTTFAAGVAQGTSPLMLIGLGTIVLLTVAVWRRRNLPLASLLVLVSLLTLSTTACGKNGGLGNTSAAPGVYTYTVTASDANISTISSSISFTITVK